MKTIVITGKQNSGKSFLSKCIALGFKKSAVINGRDKSLPNQAFPFITVDPDTDVIIFDDVCTRNLDFVMHCAYLEEIKIEKQSQAPVWIPRPVFIINLDEDVDVEKVIERYKIRMEMELIVCQRPYKDDFRFKKIPTSILTEEDV